MKIWRAWLKSELNLNLELKIAVISRFCKLWRKHLNKSKKWQNIENCEYSLLNFGHLKNFTSFKNDWAIATFSSKLKWAGQAQFLSHILQIFKIFTTLEEVLILNGLFDISVSLQLSKITTSSMSSNRGVHGLEDYKF